MSKLKAMKTKGVNNSETTTMTTESCCGITIKAPRDDCRNFKTAERSPEVSQ